MPAFCFWLMCTHILHNTIVCYWSAYITSHCLLKKTPLPIFFYSGHNFSWNIHFRRGFTLSKEEAARSLVNMSVVEWWEVRLTVRTMHIHLFLIYLMIRPNQFYKLYSQIYKTTVHIKLWVFTWIFALNKLYTHYDPR